MSSPETSRKPRVINPSDLIVTQGENIAGSTPLGEPMERFRIIVHKGEQPVIQRVPIISRNRETLMVNRGIDPQILHRTKLLSALAIRVSAVADGIGMFRAAHGRPAGKLSAEQLNGCFEEARAITAAIKHRDTPRLYVAMTLHSAARGLTHSNDSPRVARLFGINIDSAEGTVQPTPYLEIANRRSGQCSSPPDMLRATLYEEISPIRAQDAS